jgi:hypothetical protein
MKHQTTVLLSDHTRRQISQLQERLGCNKTEVILLGIERLYREEFPMNERTIVSTLKSLKEDIIAFYKVNESKIDNDYSYAMGILNEYIFEIELEEELETEKLE